MKKLIGGMVALLALGACKFNTGPTATLPVYGNRTPVTKTVGGKTVTDTIYQTIPAFKTVNQYGDSITSKNLAGNIYVADFFFTTCPSICPVMHRNMLNVYNAFKADKEVKIISYSIDPKHDSVNVLKKYADNLGIAGNTWWLLQGKKEEIYKLSESYLVRKPEEDARQLFIHDGYFILVDKQKRIRGTYDGTLPEQVTKLIADIKTLKTEPDQITGK
ncbi:SCO family protein [Mucilaginibacter sp. UR6-11]|uniref:SCO family protein n=1 Tax=Mucilaginibacter sp. UR6-11 TaxID=1435644 RepID=UPI001E596938|nr:SCO family protein [Mucilaginibacter sp. UR6-11]MCC8426160.1 SCO family protein [Mucilaginibacter sp. UR6-11]